MIDHPNLSMDALDLVDPTAPVSEGILLSSSIDEIELEDPATGDPIGEVAESNEADALATIKRARAQAEDGRWSQMSPDERQSLIDRLVGVMESRAEALAEIGTLESGTPVSYSSGIHVQAPLDVLRRVTASTNDPGLDIAVIGSHQPMYAAMQTVADSLGRGRASVVVPTAIAPLSTIALMNCLLEADLPKGVVSAVLGTPDVLTVIRSCAAEVAADTLRDSSPGSPSSTLYTTDSGEDDTSAHGVVAPPSVPSDETAPILDTDLRLFRNCSELSSTGATSASRSSKIPCLIPAIRLASAGFRVQLNASSTA